MSRPRPADLALRRARADEMAACAEIWRAGIDGYGERVGRPPTMASPGPLVALLDHLRTTDPEGFLVATRAAGDGEGPVGFVSAIRRGDVWFLGMLFVHPGVQARGVGRALLDAVLPDPEGPVVRATCTDSAQPISNAIYARLGIVPRVPIIELVGRPDRERPPRLPDGVRAVPFELLMAGSSDGPGARRLAAAVATLDGAVLGYAHPEDHAFVAASGRLGYLYESGVGEVLGYGYTSAAGRLGPIALADDSLFPAVLGHLLEVVEPAGAFSAWVPGAAGRAVTALLETGLRIEDFPALLCWDRPFGEFSRYVPITLAVL